MQAFRIKQAQAAARAEWVKNGKSLAWLRLVREFNDLKAEARAAR